MDAGTAISLTIAGLSGVAVPVFIVLFTRATRRGEQTSRELDKRLRRMERKQNRHTRALTNLSNSHTTILESQKQMTDGLEELDDAVRQLQLAEASMRERQEAYKLWRQELGAR